MKLNVAPGKYVIAVSGGVDSMALLDMLWRLPDIELVVAHFEHGIRQDSDRDRQFVEEAAAGYGLPFVFEHGHLGETASEAEAREARYSFLRRIKTEYDAKAIITAHHQDDLAETAVLNLLRGTGRKGLASLRSTSGLLRPLLHMPKQDIIGYAQTHHIAWCEDSTNTSDRYLRNYIRHHLMPRIGEAGRAQLLRHIEKAEALNPDIDNILFRGLAAQPAPDELRRQWFIMLPYAVSCEVMATWLRQNKLRDFDKKAIERLVIVAKVATSGKESDINATYILKVGKTTLQLVRRRAS
jgi:tRNA(Ile)-lysidine synthetase-like protein